jgi:hypothetical protein
VVSSIIWKNGASCVLPPIDYPQDNDGSQTPQSNITYAALLDRAAAEEPITEDMIREACNNMDAAQQFPFATQHDAIPEPIKQLLTKLRSVKR